MQAVIRTGIMPAVTYAVKHVRVVPNLPAGPRARPPRIMNLTLALLAG